MNSLLKQIKKMKDNLYQEVAAKNFTLLYNKDFNEQDENKVAQKLLDAQALLLSVLYDQGILKVYCHHCKNVNLSAYDISNVVDPTTWNLIKKDHRIYFSDLLNMVEIFIKKKPSKIEDIKRSFSLLNEIFLLRHQLIHFFKPLVLYYAKRYNRSNQLAQLDLQQEGFLGLIQAIETFYFIETNKLIKSYFTFFIKHQIKKSLLENQDGVRVPYQASLKRFLETIKQDQNESIDQYKNNFKYYYFQEIADSHYDKDMLDNIEIESSPIDDLLWNKSLSNTLEIILNSLSDREKEVIKMRYGFDRYTKPSTLDIIGKKLNLTKERVRQIEKDALKKIRSKSKNILVKEDLLDER